MRTVAEALREGAARLEAASDTPRLDAELLMAYAFGCSRSNLLLRHLGEAAPDRFEELIQRRLAHEPVAYLTGLQEFYGLQLEITRDVLIPRADSETLVEAAREVFADHCAPRRILDLGTGSGALLLAALSVWSSAEGVGIDRSLDAVLIAKENAERVGVNKRFDLAEHEAFLEKVGASGLDTSGGVAGYVSRGRAGFRVLDWTNRGWRDQLGQFDLILCNPPYVEDEADLSPDVRVWEPAGALFAGPDGLNDYPILIRQVPKLLAENGVAIFEIGHTQAEAVTAIAAGAGFTAELRRDLGGRPRALILRRV